MAQLDRFLNLLITNNATSLVLTEGEIATLTIKDQPRPVMKQALTSAQILTLVREIAPANQPHQLDAQGSVRFQYTCADGTFEVSMTQNGKIGARIEPATTVSPRTNPVAVPPVAGFTPTSAATSTPTPAAPSPAPSRSEARPTPAAAAPRSSLGG